LKRHANTGKSDPADENCSGERRLILAGTLLYGAFSSFHLLLCASRIPFLLMIG
jgi:hypothetical protein